LGNAALDVLRARIRALEGGPRIERRRAPSGVEIVDRLLGGLPVPGVVEVCGADGAGRTRLALDLAAAITSRRNLVAWVDPLCRLHPPAAAARGVALERLLILRPVCERASGSGWRGEDGTSLWAWSTEQILRSGSFPLVVTDLPPRTGSRRVLSHGWARAAEHGRCTAFVLSHRTTRELPADVRLSIGDRTVTVLRDRGGLQLLAG
jgi:hypothetical protein